jgi:hypothetical protein
MGTDAASAFKIYVIGFPKALETTYDIARRREPEDDNPKNCT